MTEYLPLYKGKKGEIVTQFDMKKVEKVGLIKFDFLGLRTMTVIEDCLDIIREQGKKAPDLDTLALDDPDTFAIFAKGDTDGIFQVESSGMAQISPHVAPGLLRRHRGHARIVQARPVGHDRRPGRQHGG